MPNADTRGPLRVALIGAGKMGQHHLRAVAASGVATVVGIADPAASRQDLGELLPADAILETDASEMLRKAKPEVVHIVTPPGSHAELAEMALAAGCHVYVEKPVTPTRDEAARVLSFAEARGLRVCAGHQVLFEAPALAVWEALPRIGRVVHVESYFSFRMVRRTITPVEQLKDILPHAIYPVVEQMRAANPNCTAPIEVVGVSLRADGDAYALLRLDGSTAVVIVTLNGRPVEQYQVIVGTNGSLRPDYIGGGMAALIGPGTGPGVLLTPFRRAFSTLGGTARGIVRLLRGGSYPGLRTLVRQFYRSILDGTVTPVSPRSILDTVDLCERIGASLDVVDREAEVAAAERLRIEEISLTPLSDGSPRVLVTGGSGMLGRSVVAELRRSGFAVRSLGRRIPAFGRRVPGVEYVSADLARGLEPSILQGVSVIVHAAAETGGGQQEQQRNSIDATRQLIEAAAAAGIKRLVHVSSIAVLRSSAELGRAIDETAPIDAGNLGRGPYVWGKAESEVLAKRLAAQHGISLRIIRPGPLVDYDSFSPPGRLGRELGPVFVAMGPARGSLSVCDVSAAARVIRLYLDDFEAAPPVLNLVESPAPTRSDLLKRYLSARPDLRPLWFPSWLLRITSGLAKPVQRFALGSKSPVDIASAFASERYNATLAGTVLARAAEPRADHSR